MDHYAHRMHKAQLVNGVVRMEFSILKPDEKGQFDPEAPVKPDDVTFSANMPLSGFMRSLGVMREFVQQLQKDGMLGEEGEKARGPQANRGRQQSKMRDITKDDDSDEQLV